MRTTKQAIVAAAVLAGLVAGAESVRADQVAVAGTAEEASAPTTRAEQLEKEARALFSAPKQYGHAARLLQEAAAEREAGDPERIRDLQLASRLTFYRGNEWKALELMTKAADEALSVGDVITAAHTYADAAFLAKAGKRGEAALDLAKKALRLAESPLIERNDRAAILARVQA